MDRVPIIDRFPIVRDYIPCFSMCGVDGCTCEHITTDRIIVVGKGSDWSRVMEQLNYNKDNNLTTTLSANCMVPKEVLWASSYSADNAVHMEIDLMDIRGSMRGAEHMALIANKCGMFYLLHIKPIIPGITMLYDVLGVIDRFKSCGDYCVMLSFYSTLCDDIVDGCDNSNMIRAGGRWRCSDLYIDNTMEVINTYCKPRKIKVGYCECV